LIGRVKAKSKLEGDGAEILESSMILGDNAYDIIVGWLGAPTSSFEEHAYSSQRAEARAASQLLHDKPLVTDEDLLATYLMKVL
jgi:hypothetical protein